MDLEKVEDFEWDNGNARKSIDKHDVSQPEAEQVFLSERLLIVEDVRHSQSEPRFHALGTTDQGRRLHVTFTLRRQGTKIRVISARDMSRKERAIYERET